MTRPVIVTRTLPDANETARALEALGFRPVLSPMLEIVSQPADLSVLERATHIIFTSANGVRALAGFSPPPLLTAWCVGPTTSAAARAAGYVRIREGPGNARELAETILAAQDDSAGLFVHVANEDAAGDLVARLNAAGIEAVFAAPYRTLACKHLSPEALAALSDGSQPILLVHSARAAGAVAASGADLSGAALVAISEAALQPLKGRAGLGEWVASEPREAALLDAVQAAALAVGR